MHGEPSTERPGDAGVEGAVGALEEVAEPPVRPFTTMAHHVGGITRNAPGQGEPYFFRYTFTPTFSSRSGTATFPSVDATMMVLPDEEGPNSFDKSTLMIRMFPSTVS